MRTPVDNLAQGDAKLAICDDQATARDQAVGDIDIDQVCRAVFELDNLAFGQGHQLFNRHARYAQNHVNLDRGIHEAVFEGAVDGHQVSILSA